MTGIAAASPMKTILAISSNPNQSEIRGIHARSAICFSPLNQVMTTRSAIVERPSNSPINTPAPEPNTNPRRSRRRLAASASRSSPLANSCHAVAPTCSSGGRNWRLTRPEWLATSQVSSRPIGKTSPRPSDPRAALLDTVNPPALQAGFDHGEDLVAHKADHADHDHGDQHGIEPEHLTAPDQEVAESLRRGQQLDADQRNPGVGQPVAQAREDRRYRSREDDMAQHLQGREAECFSHLDERPRHVRNARAGFHDHWHKCRLRDHDDLEPLPDAEQQHREWNPGQRRHLGDRREQRTDIIVYAPRQPHGGADDQASSRTDREA